MDRDLISFKTGVYDVLRTQDSDHSFPINDRPPLKPPAPSGAPVKKYTSEIFSPLSTNQEQLATLTHPESGVSYAPHEYDELSHEAYRFLTALEKQWGSQQAPPSLHLETLKQALAALGVLQEDRALLKDHQSALERI